MTTGYLCPSCGSETNYQMMSGGREFYCPKCGNNGNYPEEAEGLPRATLLRTEEGRTALRAMMDQETARWRDETRAKEREKREDQRRKEMYERIADGRGGVGLTYEGEPDSRWDQAPWCTKHEAYEMFHTCAGGPGEPLGYCGAWDGTVVGSHEVDGRSFGGDPNCTFEEREYIDPFAEDED